MATSHPTSVSERPASQRLASAKLALLNDTNPSHAAHKGAARPGSTGQAVLDAVRDKPLLAAGGAALLGFFLVRKNFFFKTAATKIVARLGMNAIKQAFK